MAGCCKCGNEPSGFHKTQVIFGIAEKLSALQGGFCSLKLVCSPVSNILFDSNSIHRK